LDGRRGDPGADGRLRGWHRCETLEDVEEHERLVDRYAERNPGMVDQSDAAIARELLKMVRWSIERHDGP
jgi:hypothetical protein